MFDRQEMLDSLDEFYDLYQKRPIKNNDGGMKSAHMFPSWFVIRKLKPKIIIESGVWKGLGTWFFKQASPTSSIISIDPEPRFREYTDSGVRYITDDFLTLDFTGINPDDIFVFFDDHQNCIPRLKKCVDLGISRVMVEDNYPHQQGDCYSPKKILADRDFIIDTQGQRYQYAKRPEDLKFLQDHITKYEEAPPIFKGDFTRWGDRWNHLYPTPDPLLGNDMKDSYPTFYDEKLDYTWICYLELA